MADLEGYPVLRIDQIPLIPEQILGNAVKDVEELIQNMLQEPNGSQNTFVQYLRKQLDSMNVELRIRADSGVLTGLLDKTRRSLNNSHELQFQQDKEKIVETSHGTDGNAHKVEFKAPVVPHLSLLSSRSDKGPTLRSKSTAENLPPEGKGEYSIAQPIDYSATPSFSPTEEVETRPVGGGRSAQLKKDKEKVKRPRSATISFRSNAPVTYAANCFVVTNQGAPRRRPKPVAAPTKEQLAEADKQARRQAAMKRLLDRRDRKQEEAEKARISKLRREKLKAKKESEPKDMYASDSSSEADSVSGGEEPIPVWTADEESLDQDAAVSTHVSSSSNSHSVRVSGVDSSGVNSAGVNNAGVNSAGVNSAGVNSAGVNSAGVIVSSRRGSRGIVDSRGSVPVTLASTAHLGSKRTKEKENSIDTKVSKKGPPAVSANGNGTAETIQSGNKKESVAGKSTSTPSSICASSSSIRRKTKARDEGSSTNASIVAPKAGGKSPATEIMMEQKCESSSHTSPAVDMAVDSLTLTPNEAKTERLSTPVKDVSSAVSSPISESKLHHAVEVKVNSALEVMRLMKAKKIKAAAQAADQKEKEDSQQLEYDGSDTASPTTTPPVLDLPLFVKPCSVRSTARSDCEMQAQATGKVSDIINPGTPADADEDVLPMVHTIPLDMPMSESNTSGNEHSEQEAISSVAKVVGPVDGVSSTVIDPFQHDADATTFPLCSERNGRYVCSVGPDELQGLLQWSLTSSGADGFNVPSNPRTQWDFKVTADPLQVQEPVDGAELLSSAMSKTSLNDIEQQQSVALAALRTQRAKLTKMLPHQLVCLLNKLSNVLVKSCADGMTKWGEAVESFEYLETGELSCTSTAVLQQSEGGVNSSIALDPLYASQRMVSVCGNCYAVAKKVESISRQIFGWAAVQQCTSVDRDGSMLSNSNERSDDGSGVDSNVRRSVLSVDTCGAGDHGSLGLSMTGEFSGLPSVTAEGLSAPQSQVGERAELSCESDDMYEDDDDDDEGLIPVFAAPSLKRDTIDGNWVDEVNARSDSQPSSLRIPPVTTHTSLVQAGLPPTGAPGSTGKRNGVIGVGKHQIIKSPVIAASASARNRDGSRHGRSQLVASMMEWLDQAIEPSASAPVTNTVYKLKSISMTTSKSSSISNLRGKRQSSDREMRSSTSGKISVDSADGDVTEILLSDIYTNFSMIFPVAYNQSGAKNVDSVNVRSLLECMRMQVSVYNEWLEVMGDYATVFNADARGFDTAESSKVTDRSGSVYDGSTTTLHYRVKSIRPEVYNIVSDVFNSSFKNDWIELPTGLGLGLSWNLLWTWQKPRINIDHLLIWQRVNHFKDSKQLTRKDLLKKNLQRYTDMGGSASVEFEVMPQTFLLPHEYTQFVKSFTDMENRKILETNKLKEELSSISMSGEEEAKIYSEKIASIQALNFWIMKPIGLSRGRGISMVKDLAFSYSQSSVIQRYVEKPLLLNGYKFDLRLYVLVTSFRPLEVFIYKEGFARVSTLAYSSSVDSLDNLFIHLTNSSIQKLNTDGITSDNPLIASTTGQQRRVNSVGVAEHNGYVNKPKGADAKDERTGTTIGRDEETSSESNGSKIPLHGDYGLWVRLQKQGVDIGKLWRNICLLVLKTVVAVDEKMTHQPCCFEVFGFDVLIDEKLRSWLLEVNASPSLARENQLDVRVKNAMIEDTIRLLNVPPYNRAAVTRILKRRLTDMSKSKGIISKSGDPELEGDLRDILGEYIPRRYGEDPEYIGDYQKLCPNTKIMDHVAKIQRKIINRVVPIK